MGRRGRRRGKRGRRGGRRRRRGGRRRLHYRRKKNSTSNSLHTRETALWMGAAAHSVVQTTVLQMTADWAVGASASSIYRWKLHHDDGSST
jgi:hypothetical protein